MTAETKQKVWENVRSFGLAILIALTIRAFFIEAFKIPSTSMVPSLLVGDHLFVNKMAYGIRIPFTNDYINEFDSPKRGEVIVFINPVEEDKHFIKRVIGLPGDVVDIQDKQVWVNGQPLEVTPLETETTESPNVIHVKGGDVVGSLPTYEGWDSFLYFSEKIDGHPHWLQYHRTIPREGGRWVVPADHYFVMGDNRDLSSDSRVWGFVPKDHIRGRAMFIWMSWDSERWRLRWERIGTGIH